MNYCRINTEFNQLCRSDIFWKDLVNDKFGNVDKLCDSWYETYLYHYKYSKVYILNITTDCETEILGLFPNKELAFKYMINHIVEHPRTIVNTEFIDLLLQDNPEYNAFELIDELTHKNVDIINSLISYLREIVDRYGCYVIKYDPYTQFHIFSEEIISK